LCSNAAQLRMASHAWFEAIWPCALSSAVAGSRYGSITGAASVGRPSIDPDGQTFEFFISKFPDGLFHKCSLKSTRKQPTRCQSRNARTKWVIPIPGARRPRQLGDIYGLKYPTNNALLRPHRCLLERAQQLGSHGCRAPESACDACRAAQRPREAWQRAIRRETCTATRPGIPFFPTPKERFRRYRRAFIRSRARRPEASPRRLQAPRR
jgi:hypothetical protein